MQNWDYGWNAPYYVTICTQNREYYFGNIVTGQMQLSEIGQMAEKYWFEIPQHFPFVRLGAFVVMPNHVHGIIIIDKPNDGCNDVRIVETQDLASLPYNPDNPNNPHNPYNPYNPYNPDNPDNQDNPYNPKNPIRPKNIFGPQSRNLASIVRGFKIGVTTNARKIDANFAWQSRFYDHITRNSKSFQKIETYIIENPLHWDKDKFYNY